MLTTLSILFAALWLLGVVTSYTMGGIIHVLLVAAVTLVLLRMFRERRPA
jgi:multisubunit Na+/H+ antiporter MnhE subunit